MRGRSHRQQGFSPFPPTPCPMAAALYPTAPVTLGHLHMQLWLEVLGVVEAGRVWVAEFTAGWDTKSVLEGFTHCHQEVLHWETGHECQVPGKPLAPHPQPGLADSSLEWPRWGLSGVTWALGTRPTEAGPGKCISIKLTNSAGYD